MKIKVAFGEDADGNEKHMIGYQRKNNPCYKVEENLTES